MDKNEQIIADLRRWFDEFAVALEEWESWLNRVELAYVTGEFKNLTLLEGESESIQNNLATARESRRSLARSSDG